MDKRIKEALDNEIKRQHNNIELIASENYVSDDVLALQGSISQINMPKDILVKDIMEDV